MPPLCIFTPICQRSVSPLHLYCPALLKAIATGREFAGVNDDMMSIATTTRRGDGGAHANVASEQEDNALLRNIAAQNRQAFETLYHRYAARLGSYLLKLLHQRDLVDEAVNDTFMAVWQSAARFDAERARASTWLFGIAHHKGLKALTRAAPRSWVPLDNSSVALDGHGTDLPALVSHDNPERTAMGAQLGHSLADALAELSPEHRAVIELAFVETLSYDDIARVMNCPVNTVKTRVFHARKKLSDLMQQRGHAV